MANKYTAIKIPEKQDLEYLYNELFMSQKEVGKVYGTTQKVVFSWFKKLGIKYRVAYKRFQNGSYNDNWKGDKATYAALHYRVQSARGKANKCEECNRRDDGISYDWANQTGNYADIWDYKMMCRSCHYKLDGVFKNLPNNSYAKNINIRNVIDGKI